MVRPLNYRMRKNAFKKSCCSKHISSTLLAGCDYLGQLKDKEFPLRKKKFKYYKCDQLEDMYVASRKSSCLVEDHATKWFSKLQKFKSMVNLNTLVKKDTECKSHYQSPLPRCMNLKIPLRECKSQAFIVNNPDCKVSPEFKELLIEHEKTLRRLNPLFGLPKEYTRRRLKTLKEEKDQAAEVDLVNQIRIMEDGGACDCGDLKRRHKTHTHMNVFKSERKGRFSWCYLAHPQKYPVEDDDFYYMPDVPRYLKHYKRSQPRVRRHEIYYANQRKRKWQKIHFCRVCNRNTCDRRGGKCPFCEGKDIETIKERGKQKPKKFKTPDSPDTGDEPEDEEDEFEERVKKVKQPKPVDPGKYLPRVPKVKMTFEDREILKKDAEGKKSEDAKGTEVGKRQVENLSEMVAKCGYDEYCKRPAINTPFGPRRSPTPPKSQRNKLQRTKEDKCIRRKHVPSVAEPQNTKKERSKSWCCFCSKCRKGDDEKYKKRASSNKPRKRSKSRKKSRSRSRSKSPKKHKSPKIKYRSRSRSKSRSRSRSKSRSRSRSHSPTRGRSPSRRRSHWSICCAKDRKSRSRKRSPESSRSPSRSRSSNSSCCLKHKKDEPCVPDEIRLPYYELVKPRPKPTSKSHSSSASSRSRDVHHNTHRKHSRTSTITFEDTKSSDTEERSDHKVHRKKNQRLRIRSPSISSTDECHTVYKKRNSRARSSSSSCSSCRRKCDMPRPPETGTYKIPLKSRHGHDMCYKEANYWLGVKSNYPVQYRALAERNKITKIQSYRHHKKLWGKECPSNLPPSKRLYTPFPRNITPKYVSDSDHQSHYSRHRSSSGSRSSPSRHKALTDRQRRGGSAKSPNRKVSFSDAEKRKRPCSLTCCCCCRKCPPPHKAPLYQPPGHETCYTDSDYWLSRPNFPKHYRDMARRSRREQAIFEKHRAKTLNHKCPSIKPRKQFYTPLPRNITPKYYAPDDPRRPPTPPPKPKKKSRSCSSCSRKCPAPTPPSIYKPRHHETCYTDANYWLSRPNFPKHYQDMARRSRKEQVSLERHRARTWGKVCPSPVRKKEFYTPLPRNTTPKYSSPVYNSNYCDSDDDVRKDYRTRNNVKTAEDSDARPDSSKKTDKFKEITPAEKAKEERAKARAKANKKALEEKEKERLKKEKAAAKEADKIKKQLLKKAKAAEKADMKAMEKYEKEKIKLKKLKEKDTEKEAKKQEKAAKIARSKKK